MSMEWREITTDHTGGHYCELMPAKICGNPGCNGGRDCAAKQLNPMWQTAGAPKEAGE